MGGTRGVGKREGDRYFEEVSVAGGGEVHVCVGGVFGLVGGVSRVEGVGDAVWYHAGGESWLYSIV